MNQDNIASHYRGNSGEKYSTGRRQHILNHLGYQLQKKFFTSYLETNMEVLDFGCGSGSLAKAIAPSVKSIEGLEVNEFPRKMAIEQQHLVVHADLAAIPNDRKYNAIISNHVLEHIPNVVQTLKTLRSHLHNEGKFITMLPIEDFRTRRNRHWDPNDKDHHLQAWTPLLFGNVLQEAGFMPLELRVVTHAWTPKLFFLGDTMIQSAACYLLSVYLKRRQLLAVAINNG